MIVYVVAHSDIKRSNEQPIVVDEPSPKTQAPVLPNMTLTMSNASEPEPAHAVAAAASTTTKRPNITRYGREIKTPSKRKKDI